MLNTTSKCSVTMVCRRFRDILHRTDLWDVVDIGSERCSALSPIVLARNIASGSKRWRDVQTLNLSKCTRLDTSSARMIAAHCPRLKNLNISYCETMGSKGLMELARVSGRFESIHLDHMPGIVTSQIITTIAKAHTEAGACPLKSISFASCVHVSSAAIASVLRACGPTLESFDAMATHAVGATLLQCRVNRISFYFRLWLLCFFDIWSLLVEVRCFTICYSSCYVPEGYDQKVSSDFLSSKP
eukprot:Rmarinus@m.25209